MKINKLYIIAFILTTGCTSAKITSTWIEKKANFNKYQKILVLSIYGEKDRSIQEQIENHLVNDLKENGYTAISALSEFGPKTFENKSEDEVIKNLESNNIDAIITIVLLDKKKERKYIPGNIYYTPMVNYYSRFWGYRGMLYNRIYEPGYYVTESQYFWESNLYDMSTQKMLYSVQTKSFDIKNANNFGHEYSKTIMKNMLEKGVIIKK